MKKLILIELNELNFDSVLKYTESQKLPAFESILKNYLVSTSSEKDYENLEPWIQWVSVHTGLKANQHKIFRLGDMENSELKQIFEIVNKKHSVSCISPMNTINRLSKESIFIPDPWTKTQSDSTWWSSKISKMLSQTVNDNSNNKISIISIFIILIGFLKFVRFKNYLTMIRLALSSYRSKWRKAIFLDRFIHEISLNVLKKNNAVFHTVFFNSLAHIQHHYFLNSRAVTKKISNPSWYIKESDDPLLEGLNEFDEILSDYLNYDNYEILLATGLTQKPVKKATFYWRLKNHRDFLDKLSIKYSDVKPRMTRDFLIEFNNEENLKDAINKLNSIYEYESGIKLFNEIDNRGSSLFVVLTYPTDLTDKIFGFSDFSFNANETVSFVAIKNGEHSPKGYAFCSNGIKDYMIKDGDHVSKLFFTLKNFFLNDNADAV